MILTVPGEHLSHLRDSKETLIDLQGFAVSGLSLVKSEKMPHFRSRNQAASFIPLGELGSGNGWKREMR